MRLPLIGHVVWDRAYEAGQRDALAFDKDHDHDCSYEQGQRDEREACIAAVEALGTPEPGPLGWLPRSVVIAAIRGEASA